MTVKSVMLKRNKPEITAIQIPQPCTMQDADEIEMEFGNVKREHWSARNNDVRSFKIEWRDANRSDNELIAYPGSWIVLVSDPHEGRRYYEVISKYELEYKYTIKGE